MLVGLPLLGVWLAGLPLAPYLEFPPHTRHVQHAAFSWPAFGLIAALIAASDHARWPSGGSGPIAAARRWLQAGAIRFRGGAGWGSAAGTAAWVLAWTRWPWFAALQPHTFSPLWAAYIVGRQRACCRRTGRSLLTDRPLFFGSLFPASAAFWWGFRIPEPFRAELVLCGPELGPWAYFW